MHDVMMCRATSFGICARVPHTAHTHTRSTSRAPRSGSGGGTGGVGGGSAHHDVMHALNESRPRLQISLRLKLMNIG